MIDSFFIYPLLIGFLLDSLIGDPLWLPHPIRLFGWSISKLEKHFNIGNNRKQKGILTSVFLIGTSWLFFFLLFEQLKPYQEIFIPMAAIGVFYGLANRSLIYESWLVMKALKEDGLKAGRKQLNFIVGRDTSNLNEQQIRTAVLETMAENLSDGVIAPLFFYAIGGVPLMLAFKMVSTHDSMIGYKSERYKEYGWFAARFDDFLNLIPARLTALLMVLVTFSRNGLLHIYKFGRKHSSPNAGYPEAALAGILKCRFGGSNYYHGKLIDKPYIGLHEKEISNNDFYKTVFVNIASSLLMLGFILLVARYC